MQDFWLGHPQVSQTQNRFSSIMLQEMCRPQHNNVKIILNCIVGSWNFNNGVRGSEMAQICTGTNAPGSP